jgi:tellurite resistance protein
MKISRIAAFLLLTNITALQAQNFKSELKKLEAQIASAYKNKKVTELEYVKLKREQDIIQAAVEKAQADDIMTSDEKNKIHSKIVRARKRLAKYKTNREVY